ncbi:hypothetical protein BDY17DRAFT_291417 [Neohortaea acidophila]|uniref:Translation initiation factor eIF2B subunit delta n=1 Tax=Neohortaea acidophila TaxID=245834 RepID=A0A6A6Q2B5_9PEZI|nr:uncharacterized protein BDY17DRAFT_291417 [Neohortaea acidophila]KAF2486392.1 hypothetical protein BDY17DRAFT_291417 [Neohortaea acidophila]
MADASIPTPTQEESKVSPAELKKRAKAEKQARRAAQKEQQGVVVNGDNLAAQATEAAPSTPSQLPKVDRPPKAQQQQQKQPKPSSSSQPQAMPVRQRPSQSGAPKPILKKDAPKEDHKQVELFSHLYTQSRHHTFDGVSKDVHPAVLALGFQISSYEICGSSARCVAMLLAFKEAIQAYTTPTGTSLARHLTQHYLSPQIDFLKTCRPISESMGNAIRWLKKLIVEIDPNTPEQEAKDDLCELIDAFIRERIIVTDQAIAASASRQIRDGSVVLTFAKSSIVEKTILQAHANGVSFRVVVVDSRPLFEAKSLATSLMHAGLEVEYLPFSAISHAVKQATLVLLGAHSMLGNGRLMSRIGTAGIAMQAAKADIPVIVCCESVKFSGKVALDSIVLNEVAPAEELLLRQVAKQSDIPEEDGSKGKPSDDAKSEATKVKTMADWKDITNLQVLNLMYDVTPAEYIRMVICEYGSLPPSSVPVVHRLANEGM